MSDDTPFRVCKHCGKEMEKCEDANYLYELAIGDATYAHQHLHPILDEGGNALCPGTPSLTRYINQSEVLSNHNDTTWSDVLAENVPLAHMMVMV